MAAKRFQESKLTSDDVFALIADIEKGPLKPRGFLENDLDRQAAALAFLNLQAIYNVKRKRRNEQNATIEKFLDERAWQTKNRIKMTKLPFKLQYDGGRLGDLPTAFGRYLWLHREYWIELVLEGHAWTHYRASLCAHTLRTESDRLPAAFAIDELMNIGREADAKEKKLLLDVVGRVQAQFEAIAIEEAAQAALEAEYKKNPVKRYEAIIAARREASRL